MTWQDRAVPLGDQTEPEPEPGSADWLTRMLMAVENALHAESIPMATIERVRYRLVYGHPEGPAARYMTGDHGEVIPPLDVEATIAAINEALRERFPGVRVAHHMPGQAGIWTSFDGVSGDVRDLAARMYRDYPPTGQPRRMPAEWFGIPVVVDADQEPDTVTLRSANGSSATWHAGDGRITTTPAGPGSDAVRDRYMGRERPINTYAATGIVSRAAFLAGELGSPPYGQCCGNRPAGPGFECTCGEGCACRCGHCACSPEGDNGDPG